MKTKYAGDRNVMHIAYSVGLSVIIKYIMANGYKDLIKARNEAGETPIDELVNCSTNEIDSFPIIRYLYAMGCEFCDWLARVENSSNEGLKQAAVFYKHVLLFKVFKSYLFLETVFDDEIFLLVDCDGENNNTREEMKMAMKCIVLSGRLKLLQNCVESRTFLFLQGQLGFLVWELSKRSIGERTDILIRFGIESELAKSAVVQKKIENVDYAIPVVRDFEQRWKLNADVVSRYCNFFDLVEKDARQSKLKKQWKRYKRAFEVAH